MGEAIEPVTIQSGQSVTVASVTSTSNFPGASSASTVFLLRDSFATVQATTSVTSPAADATIATITPGTAGLWEVIVTVNVSGVTVAAADSNNMHVEQTAAIIMTIPYIVPGVTGTTVPFTTPPILLNLSAADTVSVEAIGLATVGAIYTACVVARRVG